MTFFYIRKLITIHVKHSSLKCQTRTKLSFIIENIVTFRVEINLTFAQLREAERLLVLSFEMTSGPCLTLNGTTRQNTGLSFLLCFLSLGLLISSSILTSRNREPAGERIRERSRSRRRGGTSGKRKGEAGDADGPRGALGFHYAKPQMESCDRVSLRGRLPKARAQWRR